MSVKLENLWHFNELHSFSQFTTKAQNTTYSAFIAEFGFSLVPCMYSIQEVAKKAESNRKM